ncbi:MAG: type II secretion system F family protein [Bryobacteraceae bacterium]
MELWYSLALFVLVAAATALAGIRLWAKPRAVLDRLAGAPEAPAWRFPTHPSLAFRDLLARLGASLPTPQKGTAQLRKMLIRAGYYQTNAVWVVQGARVMAGAGLALAAAVVSREAAMNDRLLAAMFGAVAGAMAPGMFVSWRAKSRQHRIRRGLPDALDLLVICVESGLGLDQAIAQTAKELEASHRDISRELALVHLELKTGVRRQEALRNLGERTGVAEVKKLVAVLLQADRFGTGIAQSLRTHADFMRVQARQAAEEKVAKLGVKLVFPIFFCILPSLFVVTVGPMAVRMVRELLPQMKNL